MDRGPVGPGPDLVGLSDALASNDAPTRAAGLLRAPNVPGAEDLVVAALFDPVIEVRRTAVHVLARMAGAKGLRAIMDAATRDPAPAVRAEAVAALGRVARYRKEPGAEAAT